ncbi:MAG: DUF481 domain-containing protein [Deltaproteobacteria bacterium]|nr:DUF481 domain-containing protein [Deltaproteobacteria bacterium]MBI4224054.1 DUF481 domain-containing protein [Deltaproteobacteria bacterium]
MGVISGNADGAAFGFDASLRHPLKKFRQTLSFSSLLTTDTTPNGKYARQIGGAYRLRYFWLPFFSSFVGGGISNQPLFGQNLSASAQGGMALHLFEKQKRSARMEAGYSRSHAEETPGGASNSNGFFSSLTWSEPFTQTLSSDQTVVYETNLERLRGYSFETDSAFVILLNDLLKLAFGFTAFFNKEPVAGYQQWDFVGFATLITAF